MKADSLQPSLPTQQDRVSIPPPGLTVEHHAVPDDTWAILQHWIDTNEWLINSVKDKGKHPQIIPIPWETLGTTAATKFLPIPTQLRSLLMLEEFSNNVYDFTQCIINVYEPDTSIPWHLDDEAFGPTVLVFTFGEDRPLYLRTEKRHPKADYQQDDVLHAEFRSLEWKEPDQVIEPHLYDYYIASPKHGSRYVLTGEARHQWEHAVPPGNGLRISVTFRSHNPTFDG